MKPRIGFRHGVVRIHNLVSSWLYKDQVWGGIRGFDPHMHQATGEGIGPGEL